MMARTRAWSASSGAAGAAVAVAFAARHPHRVSRLILVGGYARGRLVRARTPEALAAELAAATGGDLATRIYLRADQAVAYGDLMGVMNRLRDSGYLKIALVGLDRASAPPAALPATP